MCPANVFATLGSACTTTLASSAGTCYSGSCLSHTEQCHEAALMFSSSGWLECSSAGDNDGDAACAPNNLKCTAPSGGCYGTLTGGDGVLQTYDGTPCATGKVCMGNGCVTVASLIGLTKAPTTSAPTKPSGCGDGIREGSEECDCGALPCSTVDPCCDDATCMLKAGAQCSVHDLVRTVPIVDR